MRFLKFLFVYSKILANLNDYPDVYIRGFFSFFLFLTKYFCTVVIFPLLL